MSKSKITINSATRAVSLAHQNPQIALENRVLVIKKALEGKTAREKVAFKGQMPKYLRTLFNNLNEVEQGRINKIFNIEPTNHDKVITLLANNEMDSNVNNQLWTKINWENVEAILNMKSIFIACNCLHSLETAFCVHSITMVIASHLSTLSKDKAVKPEADLNLAVVQNPLKPGEELSHSIDVAMYKTKKNEISHVFFTFSQLIVSGCIEVETVVTRLIQTFVSRVSKGIDATNIDYLYRLITLIKSFAYAEEMHYELAAARLDDANQGELNSKEIDNFIGFIGIHEEVKQASDELEETFKAEVSGEALKN